MSHRRFLAAVACTAIALTTVLQTVPARAQDATASVLAERAELDQALAVQDATERISRLEKFLADHPESLLGDQAREALVRSHASIGEVALKNRDPRAASEAFQRAVAAAGDKIGERLFQNVVWPMPAIMARAGYRFEGIQLMRAFEERFAAEPSRLVRIGFFYVSIESPADAVRVLERAVELAPNDHAAYSNLGTAYIISLRLDDAATAFQKAIELEPKEEFAYASLGTLRRAFGNPTDAIELYKKQLEIKEDDPESYSGLAMAYLLVDDDTSASHALARSLALAPNNFRLYTQLAYFYAARGRWDKAREMVDLSMKYEPRFAWTHIVAGNVLLGQKQYDRAIEVLLGAQQYGDFPTLHFELAKAYMVDDRFTEAVEELRAAFDITDDGQFETRLGDVLDARSSKLDLLLERERQAVLGLPIQPTTETQYRLAESLARIAHFLTLVPDEGPAATPPVEETPEETQPDVASAGLETAPDISAPPAETAPVQEEKPEEIFYTEPRANPSDAPLVYRPRRVVRAPEPVAEPPATETEVASAPEPEPESAPEPEPVAAEPAAPDANGRAIDPALRDQLAAAIDAFVGVDDGREAFRKMWVARQLAEKRVLLDKAEELARQSLDGVETAVALDGSVRDLPDADLETRRSVALARAEGTLGWVKFERGERTEGLDLMRKAVTGATNDPERLARLWRLGVAEQENGDERQALDLYLQAYDPASPSAPVRKQIIEALYVKVNGSTEGLDQRLTRP
jgi:tetratricopeptide (TPR) repeat protein